MNFLRNITKSLKVITSNYHSNSLIFLGSVLKTSYFFLTQCIKLKHKDLESCSPRMCLFYRITLQWWTWKQMIIIKTYIEKKFFNKFIKIRINFRKFSAGNFQTHSSEFTQQTVTKQNFFHKKFAKQSIIKLHVGERITYILTS